MKTGVIVLLFFYWGCTSSSGHKFSIKGDIEGIRYGTATLRAADRDTVVLYSVDIEGGKFLIEGELEEPKQYLLSVNRRTIRFFMDGRRMELSAPYDKLDHSDIKGSPANDLNQEYDLMLQREYYQPRSRLMDEYKKAQAGNEEEKMAGLLEQILDETKPYELAKAFVEKHPESPFSAHVSDVVKKESGERGEVLYALLSREAKEGYYGRLLRKHLDELAVSRVGLPCPDFEVADEQSGRMTLNEQKGHVMVLDFWASWCGPCREEMKHLKKLYTELEEKGLKMMSISLDDSGERWHKACEEEQIPWISAWEEKGWNQSEIRKAFGIQSIPFIVLLNKEGNIVAKNIRRNALREKIMELL